MRPMLVIAPLLLAGALIMRTEAHIAEGWHKYTIAERDLSQAQTGNVVFCDTADEVREFVKLSEQNIDVDDAFAAIAKDAGVPDACLAGVISFVRGSQDGDVIETSQGTVGIFVVNVVAVQGQQGNWVTVDPAVVQYVPFLLAAGRGA